MAQKLKLTGFARLIIALIVILPTAFLAGTYIKGEDPKAFLEKATNKNIEITDSEKTKKAAASTTKTIRKDSPALASPAMEKQGEVHESNAELLDKLNEMYDENTALKDSIQILKNRLKNLDRVQKIEQPQK